MVLRYFGRRVELSWAASRAIASSLLAAALFSLSAGCTSAPLGLVDPANRATGSATIVWVSNPTLRNASDDARQVLVDAFEQANPSIKVRIEPGSDSSDRLHSKLAGELSDSSAATPDVYSGDVVWPAEFGQKGLALPLNQHLPASFWQRYGGVDSTLVQGMTYRQNIYAAPYFVDKGFLYYRADLLKKAGLPPPRTWEELVHDAQVLKSRGLAYQFAWQGDKYEGLTCDLMEFLTDEFGAPQNYTGSGIARLLASRQAFDALTFMRTLITSGVSPSDTYTNEESQTDKLFDDGDVAFLRSWDSSYASALGSGSKIDNADDVGVELPPTFAATKGAGASGFSAFGGWSLYVNPNSRHLAADLTFVDWMTGVQAQRILATQFSQIPANTQVLALPSVQHSGKVLTEAAGARLVNRPSQTPDYQIITKHVYTDLNPALNPSGGVDPCQALLAAAHDIDPDVHGTLTCPAPAGSAGRPS